MKGADFSDVTVLAMFATQFPKAPKFSRGYHAKLERLIKTLGGEKVLALMGRAIQKVPDDSWGCHYYFITCCHRATAKKYRCIPLSR